MLSDGRSGAIGSYLALLALIKINPNLDSVMTVSGYRSTLIAVVKFELISLTYGSRKAGFYKVKWYLQFIKPES